MLKEKVWPAVKHSASRKGYWFQQDRARVHTRKENLSFLSQKFSNSNQQSYWQSMATFKPRPQPIRLLVLGSCWGDSNGGKAYYIGWGKTVVEELTREMESEVLMEVADHFKKRVEFCVQEKVILNTYWRNQCNFIPLYKTFICPCNNSLM